MQKKNGVPTDKIASWYYRFTKANLTAEGKRQYAYRAGFKTKKEAEIAGQEAFNIEYGLNGKNKTNQKIIKMSFRDYVNQYWWKDNHIMWKATTEDGYRKKLNNYLFREFGDKALGNISTGMLQEYFYNMYLNTAFAVSSIDNIRALLSQIFKYAVDNKHIEFNPMLSVKKPNLRIQSNVNKNKQTRDAIPDEIVEKIMERFPEGTAVHLPFRLCLDAGLRSSEALALTWDDIDFDAHCIYLSRQLQRKAPKQLLQPREKEIIDKYPELKDFQWYLTNPKYESKRIIPINTELENLLKREKEKQEYYQTILGRRYTRYYYTKSKKPIKSKGFDSFNKRKNEEDYENGILNTAGIGYSLDLVCRHEDGQLITESTLKYLSRVVRGKEKEPAIYEDFNIHSLRHTFSSKLREKGLAEHIIQDIMGHKSPTETKTYMHITNEEFSNTLRSFNQSEDPVDILKDFIIKNNISLDKLRQILQEAAN